MKKIGAILLALVMVLAMTATAFATSNGTTLDTNGEQGAFTSPDTPVVQNKTLILEKELKVYNLNESKVYAPTITYNYTIAPATVASGTTVTDKADKHTANESVMAPVKAGIGNFTASVSWANEELNAGTDGVKNVKDISIDFSNIVFTGAGIYRYEITESLANDFTYDNTGVTETTGAHTRYIDVYVKPAENFTDGSKAADWDIYGFTCFCNNTSITDSDKTTVAVKTTGFVDGSTGGTQPSPFLADQYYTYNVTISKTVVNDNYAKLTHKFPFTVIFTNGDVTKNILLKTATNGTVEDFAHTAGAPTWKGVAKLLSGGSIKYIGIPMGTDVEVYETNDVIGTTYQVLTTRTNATTETATDAMVVYTDTAPSTETQTTKQDYQSTKTVFDTTKNADDDKDHSAAITNTLLTISPTGLTLRIAPYALMLVGGIVLLLVSRRRKATAEE